MPLRNILAGCAAGLCLLAAPLHAEPQHGERPDRSHGAAGPSQYHPPSIYRGGASRPPQWGDFHHDTAPARIFPHRFTGTNLPRANIWAGNPRVFDVDRWRGGRWVHGDHASRLGWWWVVGPSWFYFNAPVYPYPDLYTPLGTPFGWWYWCDPYQEYYPYVTSCPVPWETVMPRD